MPVMVNNSHRTRKIGAKTRKRIKENMLLVHPSRLAIGPGACCVFVTTGRSFSVVGILTGSPKRGQRWSQVIKWRQQITDLSRESLSPSRDLTILLHA